LYCSTVSAYIVVRRYSKFVENFNPEIVKNPLGLYTLNRLNENLAHVDELRR